MFGLNNKELEILKNLDTPAKIQKFIDSIPINFEEDNIDTCLSPRRVLRENKCHCIEGAILAALILRIQGYKPLLVDLTASKDDFDHVIAVFKKNNKWGAISKTNHAVLRYREPVYKSVRELVMSYFHEYFNDKGKKTLRSFSLPVNISKFDKKGWTTSEKNIFYIPAYLDKVKHFSIVERKEIYKLDNASDIEMQASNITQYIPPKSIDKERIKNL